MIAAACHRLAKEKLGLTGLAIIFLLLVLAAFGPLLAPYDPTELNVANRLQGVSTAHWMGTDGFGRDVLSRIIHGGRLSLAVALAVMLLTVGLGALIGGTAGYLSGIVDELVMRSVDILLAFPKLILALAIVAALGPSLPNVMVAMVATGWVEYCRVVRGSVLSAKQKEFVEAARAIGCGGPRILLRHVMPDVIGPVVVLATLDVGHVVLSIAALSFLGLGAQPPMPEWGSMLNEGRPFMQSAPHLMLFPGLMIMLTVLGFNLLGDGLRDALDHGSGRQARS